MTYIDNLVSPEYWYYTVPCAQLSVVNLTLALQQLQILSRFKVKISLMNPHTFAYFPSPAVTNVFFAGFFSENKLREK